MKSLFYPKLAFDGIRKNKKLYIPYIFTCIVMIMMYYIVVAVSKMPSIQHLIGWSYIIFTLDLASCIIAIFSLIFLFYTNSFLTRRRQKEFGLYNILGMNKRNISKILFFEYILVAFISFFIGIILGIGLSKLFELGLINIVMGEIDYNFTVSLSAIIRTIILYSVIFVILFVKSLFMVSISNPISLLKSENTGEKPPKANFLLAISGLIILGIAYYIAVRIDDPVVALVMFFYAAALVVLATYILFISGSVFICRVLQKNKSYYYKPNHFVSVSSMAYRMKRNGAGLASICILLTMVLVMISSTTCLYFGMNDVINATCPTDIDLSYNMSKVEYDNSNIKNLVKNELNKIVKSYNLQEKDINDYFFTNESVVLESSTSTIYKDNKNLNSNTSNIKDVILRIAPISEYNKVMGENKTLNDNEVFIYPLRTEYNSSVLKIYGGNEYKVKGILDKWILDSSTSASVMPSFFVFVNDFDSFINQINTNDDINVKWIYGFNLDTSSDNQTKIYNQIQKSNVINDIKNSNTDQTIVIKSKAEITSNYYSLLGGIFYLGIILSIVFLFAAVLIIYYKQIAEGYEDRKRFEIMQKVGMTKKEIRKNINSQIIIVFFMPILVAGVHLIFAFPLISRIISGVFLSEMKLITYTVICYIIFALFYAIVYRITSSEYYSIVSSKDNQN